MTSRPGAVWWSVRIADLRRLQKRGQVTARGHRVLLDVLRAGDPEAAAEEMRGHIEARSRHAAEAVRLAFADLYAPQES